ncbi:nuclear transport factor 2 family protein [Pseudonocardia sp. GCM10023141]|uniref:nuclear transport factor 2 family protein n=1 Tax=Pseudonocardia sp. GCM10023141 TaxID=3252653 RepID=UPI003612E54F
MSTMDTTTSTNATAVADIYAAFGRGDVPAILDTLSEDVAWETWPDNFAQRAQVPHLLPRRGPAQAAEFFTVISSWTVLDFAVLDIVGGGRQVVRFRHYCDTAKHIAASSGEDTTAGHPPQ